MSARRTLLAVFGALLVGGCASPNYSYADAYYQHEPKTIVVLPVRNESTDAAASTYFLSTIARPLVQRGYYVLPIESTLEVFTREGLHTAGRAWDVKPQLLQSNLGADAALYVTITKWDTSYVVFASNVTVAMHYRLVDCHTGQVLWERSASQTKRSGGSGGGLIGLLVSAVDAAVSAAVTDYVPLASAANTNALASLPPGAYNAQQAEYKKTVSDWREANPKVEPKTEGSTKKSGAANKKASDDSGAGK
jgi:hypothetical protein